MLASTGPVGIAEASEGAGAVNEATALSDADALFDAPDAEDASAVSEPPRLQPSGASDATAEGASTRVRATAVRTRFTGFLGLETKEPGRFASNGVGTPAPAVLFSGSAARPSIMQRSMDAYPSVGSYVGGRYRIDALLGEGGMGAVFLAADAQGHRYALKFPAPDIRSRPGMMSRFANEALAASRIASEHVVKIFGVEATEDGVPFIVMELLEGTDLDAIIEQQAPVDVPRAVHFALQILRALQVSHAAGVVHRDMKPSNCFVITHNGEPDWIKLIDFGITKILGDDGANQTRTSVTMGTPAYMSPEQARSAKAAEPRSDLYSVGVILYELLTKKRPFEGDSGNELVVKICTEPPIPIRQVRPDLPPRLASAVEHALVKIPAGRYEGAQAFAHALAPFADARSVDVLQRIDAGITNLAPLAAALAPTPPVGQSGRQGGSGTAMMEPMAFDASATPPPVAEQAEGRAPQRTVVADGPMVFADTAVPAAAAPLPSPPPAVVPTPPPEYSGARSDRGGGGRGPLLAVLGVLALGLIGTGIYFATASSSGGSSTAPTTKPATTSEPDEEEDTPEGKKKKKKPAEEEPTAAPPPTEDTAGAPKVAAPTTATKTTKTTPDGGIAVDAGTVATDASVPPKPSGTTTAPTIVLPSGWTFPPGGTTAPPPATTTAPTTTAPPPATTTAPAPTGSVPILLPGKLGKPKIGGK